MELDNDRLNQIATILQVQESNIARLDKAIATLDATVVKLRDERLYEMQNRLTVATERVDRLQLIVYGGIALFITQIVGIIGAVVLWLIKK